MKKIDDNFFDIINSFSEPFRLEDIYKKISLKKNDKLIKNIETFFQMTDQFVIEKDLIFPKNSFLKKINLQIIPTDFEIENRILILGHRIIPLQSPGFNVDDVNLYFNNKKIKIIEKKIESKEINIYFSLLNFQKNPIKNFHDVYFNNAKYAEINLFDMNNFYKENNFISGDSIIIKYKNFKKCEFNIEYYSKNKQQENFFFTNKINETFIMSLKKTLKLNLSYPSIEKQLLYSFYFIKDHDFTVPVTSLGPLLSKNEDILIGSINNGIKVLFLKGQNLNDFQNYPDLNEIEESIDELELDINSVDSILNYYGNTNSETIIRALIFNQLVFDKYDYHKIIDYLFKEYSKPHLPEKIENILHKHIDNIHKEILISFKKNPPILPINIIRKNILEILLKITLFIRKLDKDKTLINNIPKEDFYNLSEICSSLEDMLYYIEDAFNGGKKNYKEIEQLDETINLFNNNLQVIFNDINNKINK